MAFGNKPQDIGSVLKEFLKKIPQKKELKKGFVLHYWPQVVGKKIASVTRNVHFENDNLVVEVESSAWRHEIHMSRFAIIKKLNEKAGSKVVKNLIVRSV